jgi:hypothetical protein
MVVVAVFIMIIIIIITLIVMAAVEPVMTITISMPPADCPQKQPCQWLG